MTIDEGYTKFKCNWVRDDRVSENHIRELNAWRQRLYDAGLIGYYEEHEVGYGNLSVRAGAPGEFIISGTQTGHIPILNRRHYSWVSGFDISANTVTCHGECAASSESMTHAAIYELSGTINSVVHVHSATLWAGLLDRAAASTKPEIAYGTPEMANEFARLYNETEFADEGVAVMTGHDEGVLSFGRTIAEAAQRLLVLL